MTCWSRFPTKQGALLNLRPAFELCTHPSTNTQTQINRPAVSWSQRYSVKASGWERGPEAFGRAQTSQPERRGSQVAQCRFCQLISALGNTTRAPCKDLSPALVSTVKDGGERMPGKERGHFHPQAPQFITECSFSALQGYSFIHMALHLTMLQTCSKHWGSSTNQSSSAIARPLSPVSCPFKSSFIKKQEIQKTEWTQK